MRDTSNEKCHRISYLDMALISLSYFPFFALNRFFSPFCFCFFFFGRMRLYWCDHSAMQSDAFEQLKLLCGATDDDDDDSSDDVYLTLASVLLSSLYVKHNISDA